MKKLFVVITLFAFSTPAPGLADGKFHTSPKQILLSAPSARAKRELASLTSLM
jgi:hypothetical protein